MLNPEKNLTSIPCTFAHLTCNTVATLPWKTPIAFLSKEDHSRVCLLVTFVYIAFLLLWPWPWPDDLDIWNWPKYSENIQAFQNKHSRSSLSKNLSMNRTDTRTDTDRHTQRQMRPNLLPQPLLRLIIKNSNPATGIFNGPYLEKYNAYLTHNWQWWSVTRGVAYLILLSNLIREAVQSHWWSQTIISLGTRISETVQ